MSITKARAWRLPLVKRAVPRVLSAYNNTVDISNGRYYTEELMLRHQENHFTRLSFKLTAIDKQCNIILPH